MQPETKKSLEIDIQQSSNWSHTFTLQTSTLLL